MKKNKLLNVAIAFCKLIKLFYILSFVFITIIFIHFQIDKDYYKDVNLYFSSPSGFGISQSETWNLKTSKTDQEVFFWNQLTTTSLYVNYFKYTVILILMFLCFKEFQKVMESVKSAKTFHRDNIVSFRQIGKYSFLLFLLISFTWTKYQHGAVSGFHISFTPLLIMVLAFIMAEVFKEGSTIQAENDLTI